MYQLSITRRRVSQLIDRIHSTYYSDQKTLSAGVLRSSTPVPHSDIDYNGFESIQVGEEWGKLWDSAWFRFTGTVPNEWAGNTVVALLDVGAEGCVFREGSPWMGLTYKRVDETLEVKRRVPLGRVTGGEPVDLLVEAAANGLFGLKGAPEPFCLRQAEIALFDPEQWQLYLDLEFLYGLADALPEDSTRARRLFYGLNEVANIWADGAGLEEARAITRHLLAHKANASAPTAWSVGHAHIDLGWLWPIRETRRKAGRSFATVLRMLEEYPDYIFGASQPQLFSWVKDDYPGLYEEIKRAVASGRWELQGAMWVEPDMNIPSGESLVRQLIHGKRFFREEFGQDLRNLWLPDVFGYSAALPQILQKAGVDIFMTQKISWNERNVFPHHTFLWEGIDGTGIRTHFLPTNNYNLSNEPHKLIAAERRFHQSAELDGFLNLYGVGDGGGGPSRKHIERARRGADTEGMPRMKMATAESFFHTLRDIPEASLPKWVGELYLEFHRGTYTTQANMKRFNRRIEHLLHDVELLAVLTDRMHDGAADRDRIWKQTLLHQFHDILPGSSINWVYRDAHRESLRCVEELTRMRDTLAAALLNGRVDGIRELAHEYVVDQAGAFVVYNALAWDRVVIVKLRQGSASVAGFETGDGTPCPVVRGADGCIHVRVPVPSCGYTVVSPATDTAAADTGGPVTATVDALENEYVRVTLSRTGTISSIYRKDLDCEYLVGDAAVYTLWEDRPYNYDAWDVSHYYRETTPEYAVVESVQVVAASGFTASVRIKLRVGNSGIDQVIRLEAGNPAVYITCSVDWKEEHRMLRVGAASSIRSNSARYEIQFGQVTRPTHSNTSWDEARFEVVAHRYADLSRADAGLAILNDCKYGHRILDTTMELTLLRSPKHPDPEADMGLHQFTYAYYPHAGARDQMAVVRRAHELNSTPLIAGLNDNASVAPHASFFRVESQSVKLEVVKPSENLKGTVLRLYECLGNSDSASIAIPNGYTEASETDLLENVVGRLEIQRGFLHLKLKPFEIRTVLLT
ncbi:MAG: alpha-mannosidase [Spirochaetaceae bacterium]